jgi:2-polyprenyl-3-methyl-5-hydroxy-6-metoxy-1,4-benzoquinol methylase
MSVNNITVVTQDTGPGLSVDISVDISQLPNSSYDVVTAFDVVEHVPHVKDFINDLIRVARHSLYLTTPNPMHTLNTHVYHYKEYLPSELLKLFEAQGAQFKVGWMMFPHGICGASRSEFLSDPYCYNYCAGFDV